MIYGEFCQQHGFEGEYADYANYGMNYMSNNEAYFSKLPRRQRRREMKRKVISNIRQEYGLGPIATIFLFAILSKIARVIVDFWWERWFGDD